MALRDFFARLTRRGKAQAKGFAWHSEGDASVKVPLRWVLGSGYSGAASGVVDSSALFVVWAELVGQLASIPVEVQGPGERNRLLLRLLTMPNPDMSMADLIEYTVGYMLISGNAYWYLVDSQAGRNAPPAAIIPLNDAQVRPVPGKTRLVDYYEYTTPEGRVEHLPPEKVIHFRYRIDPRQPYMGIGPVMALLREVEVDVDASEVVASLLSNDAVPPFMLSTDEHLQEFELDMLEERWHQKYGGVRRGRVPILSGGLKPHRIALTLNEMAVDALKRIPESRIAGAFGVPPIVVGFLVGLEHGTYANYREALRHYMRGPVTRLGNRIMAQVNRRLLPLFDEDPAETEIRFAYERTYILQEELLERYKTAQQGVAGGWVTVNEGRELVGLEPLPGQDVFLRGLNIVDVPPGGGSQGNQAQGKAQAAAEAKARMTAKDRERYQKIAQALRDYRLVVTGRTEAMLQKHFREWAERAAREFVARAKGAPAWETKADPPEWVQGYLDDLFGAYYEQELTRIIQGGIVELLTLSWDVWNYALGVQVIFDQNDPAVLQALDNAAQRVRMITETTRQAVVEAIRAGYEAGEDIMTIAARLRGIVEETYRGRARTIARTELGTAQNTASVMRYRQYGIAKVYVMDNGLTDDDPPCQEANGQIWDIEKAQKNPLEHPNCTRAFSPIVPGLSG